MARSKSQPAQEAKADDSAAEQDARDQEATAGQPDQSEQPSATDGGATDAQSEVSAPADGEQSQLTGFAVNPPEMSPTDGGEQGEDESSADAGLDPERLVEVLILRDETVDGIDYRPGSTPSLPARNADRLLERRVADANPGAIRAAKSAHGGARESEQVIE
ncbi:hypothetical protein EVC62_02175 [Salinicola endophyticus]|uniref:Uncharacterized protein n=1 Tax=Salinicola endophyticus TaxID=1949083 RepID=A0ABY8FGV4_9GAMM|nr:hypothetical protein [Salinicola endophyticus]WFF40401.1 hypothetical protein EVC62_02175 [Salinicola endophyticus]